MQSGQYFLVDESSNIRSREIKKSLTNKGLNLTTTVILHLNKMSLDVSFES